MPKQTKQQQLNAIVNAIEATWGPGRELERMIKRATPKDMVIQDEQTNALRTALLCVQAAKTTFHAALSAVEPLYVEDEGSPPRVSWDRLGTED